MARVCPPGRLQPAALPTLILSFLGSMVSRLLLSTTTLLALLCLSVPGASACEKHIRAHATDSDTSAQGANR